MKERFKNFWKQNGFYTVLTGALVVVLSISGIAGYRSGIKDKTSAANAAQFEQAEQMPLDDMEQNNEAMEAVNADVAETFGEDAEMVMPTDGEVLKPFSMDTTIYFETLDQYKCNPSMLIKANVNQEVVAAFGGKVVSIEENRVAGTVLTVDMGNGYKAMYGQMKDISVKEGDTLVKGQAIGNVAQPTKYFNEEGPHLLFAMTKDDTPINPQDYLK